MVVGVPSMAGFENPIQCRHPCMGNKVRSVVLIIYINLMLSLFLTNI